MWLTASYGIHKVGHTGRIKKRVVSRLEENAKTSSWAGGGGGGGEGILFIGRYAKFETC